MRLLSASRSAIDRIADGTFPRMQTMVFLAREGSFAATGRNRPWTPEVRQGEHAECGLAALAIMLGHHGVHVPLAEMRRRAGTTLFGSTIGQLRDLARSYGFDAKAHRTEPAEICALGLPLIAHVRFIHFVVVEHLDETVVHMNDPACGPIILERAEFDRDFTGIVLSMEPQTLAKRGRAFSFCRAVLRAWQGQWAHLALASMASASGGILATAGIWCLASNSTESATGLSILAACLCMTGIAVLLAERAGFSTQQRWADTVLERLDRASNEHYLFTRPEQTLAQLSALDDLQKTGLAHALLMSLWLSATLGAGSLIAPATVLPVVLLALVQMGLVVRASMMRGGDISRHGHAGLAASGIAAEHLTDSDWYRLGGAGDGLFSHLAGIQARAARNYFRTGNAQRTLQTTLFTLDLLKVALVLRFPASADLLLPISLAAGSSVLIRYVGTSLPFQPLRDALHRLDDLPPLSAQMKWPRLKTSGDGVLSLQNAGWSTGGRLPIIDNLSCSVSPGHILVVHGPSGGGATTLARLACGMLQPTTGIVSLDGLPLCTHPPGTAILVDHSNVITPGTVRDNLRFGKDGISESAMWVALSLVGLDQTIARRGGLSIVLKSDQPRFSGGQLRRIAIARALCRAPQVLVLDEALDNVETVLARTILARLRSMGLILIVTTKNAELTISGDTLLTLEARDAA